MGMKVLGRVLNTHRKMCNPRQLGKGQQTFPFFGRKWEIFNTHNVNADTCDGTSKIIGVAIGESAVSANFNEPQGDTYDL